MNCQLCSKLSYGLKKLHEWLTFGRLCRSIHISTYDSRHRVGEINAIAKDCICENYRMSRFSPGVVKEKEKLARFVFCPMHRGKNGKWKPAIFSQVSTTGCSIQREDLAGIREIGELVTSRLTKNHQDSWGGVLLADCSAVRAISIDETRARAVCVFGTAEEFNPAHAEMCQTHHVTDEDGPELRRYLFAAFGEGNPVKPADYRQGALWRKLEPELQQR